MADSNQTISIITLNVNHLNITIQRQTVREDKKKNQTQMYVVYKIPTVNVKKQVKN